MHEDEIVGICDALLAVCGEIRREAGEVAAKPLLLHPINKILDLRNLVSPPKNQPAKKP